MLTLGLHPQWVESKLDEIEVPSQQDDEVPHVVGRGIVLVDMLCEMGEKSSSLVLSPESRRRTPGVLSRIFEQLFDIFVRADAILVQQDSKISQGRAILPKEWMRLASELTEELANVVVPRLRLIVGRVLIGIVLLGIRPQTLKDRRRKAVQRQWSLMPHVKKMRHAPSSRLRVTVGHAVYPS